MLNTMMLTTMMMMMMFKKKPSVSRMIYNSELHLKGHDVFLELYRLTTDFVILFPMNSSIDQFTVERANLELFYFQLFWQAPSIFKCKKPQGMPKEPNKNVPISNSTFSLKNDISYLNT